MDDLVFLSDAWIGALDDAARARPPVDGDDPLADVRFSLEQRLIDDDRRWRLQIEHGAVRVLRPGGEDPEPDAHLRCSAEVARAIARGERPALDAFVTGDLTIGGDVGALLANRAALETLGDLFAAVADRVRVEEA